MWWNDGAIMAHAGFPDGTGQTPKEHSTFMKNLVFESCAFKKTHRKISGRMRSSIDYEMVQKAFINYAN